MNANVISYYNCIAVVDTIEMSSEYEQEYIAPETLISEDESDVESIDSDVSDKQTP